MFLDVHVFLGGGGGQAALFNGVLWTLIFHPTTATLLAWGARMDV